MGLCCSRAIISATQWIANGGVIAYPTEFVYGLGCDPWSEAAVKRILELKGRSPGKGLILIAGSVEQISRLVQWPDWVTTNKILGTWPGPTTWIFQKRSSHVPPWLTGNRPTVAVRVSAHPTVQALCAAIGPLVSTSANPSRFRPAKDALGVRKLFGRRLDAVVSGRVQFVGLGSEIRDACSGRVLRASSLTNC